MNKEQTIYNYQLIIRIRSNPVWISFYFLVLLLSYLISRHVYSNISWSKIFILIPVYYLLYLFWGTWYLFMINRRFKMFWPHIPWFGVAPKNMLSLQEYKRFEFSYLLLSLLSFFWIILWIPNSLHIFSFAFILTLLIFRFFLLIRIMSLNNTSVWIKYEIYGISVYKTD